MRKRMTPAEQRAHNAVKRLTKIRDSLTARAKEHSLDRDITAQMAAAIGVPRETLSRWLTWARKPTGLYVPAIENYCERAEA